MHAAGRRLHTHRRGGEEFGRPVSFSHAASMESVWTSMQGTAVPEEHEAMKKIKTRSGAIQNIYYSIQIPKPKIHPTECSCEYKWQ